jgi:hypothetical protein
VNLKHYLYGAALAGLLLVGQNLRLSGIAAPSLHPDEPTIGRWLIQFSEQGEITDRLYPGGFFRLAAPVRSAARAWVRFQSERDYRTGAADRVTVPWDDIRFARRLNAALGLLTGLCVFFLALQITGSRPAALAAAAFCLLNPVHVEHCHYAETDTAMLFALSLTLLLWARALFTGRAFFILAGAFAAGFAAGTKFPLIILFAPLLAIPFCSRENGRKRRGPGQTWALAGVSLLLFAAAFAWTNPGVFEPARFFGALSRQGRDMQGELSMALGGVTRSPLPIALWRLRMLGQHASDAGLLFLCLAAAGLAAVATLPRFRKAWPLLILAPLPLIALNLFASPFIRKQEFMTYLPFLAVLAALPLALPPWPSFRAGRLVLRSAATLAVLTALLQTHLDASRVAGLFGWTDPRLMARRWNALHAPADRSVAVENSAASAAEESYARHLALRHVADLQEGITLIDRHPVDYVIRDEFARGRGLTDPFTGQFRPRHAPLWTNFQARTLRLKLWSPILSERANASHAGHAAALYAMDAKRPALDLRIPLDEPFLISEAGRETGFIGSGADVVFQPGDSAEHAQLGGNEAVLLTGQPRELAVGGPGPVRSLRVTLITDAQEAKASLTAWGRTTTIRLPANTEQEVTLYRPWWRLGREPYVRISGRSERGTCLLVQGRLPAGGYKPSAGAGKAWSTLLQMTNATFAINGIPESIYNDFARIRDLAVREGAVVLDSDRLRRRDSATLRTLKEDQIRRLGRDPGKTCLSPSPYRTPFRLAKGRYRLALTVRPLPTTIGDEAPASGADLFELTEAGGRTLFTGRWSELPLDRDAPLQFELDSEQAGALELFLVTPVPRTLSIRGAELSWTLRDRLLAFQRYRVTLNQ